MKKIIIPFLFTPSLVFAQSQSNIQIYGVADAYVEAGKWMGDSINGVGETGGIRPTQLGFRGEEDLGGGLKAIFVLEEGYDIGTGKSAAMLPRDSQENPGSDVFTRQAFVGLKGSLGQISAGRQYAPGFYTYDYDAGRSASLGPYNQLVSFTGFSMAPGAPARFNNSVNYTGTFDSIIVRAMYAFGNRETKKRGLDGYDQQDDDRFGLAVNYGNGPVKLGAAFHEVKYKYNSTINNNNQKEYMVGASYKFDFATFMGMYQKGSNMNGYNDLDVDVIQLGTVIPIAGNDELRISYSQAKVDFPVSSNQNLKAATVVYIHPLSKRTALYGGYLNIDFDNLTWGTAKNYAFVSPSMNGHSPNDNINSTRFFYVGVSHAF